MFYANLAKTADKLIASKGQVVTLTQVTEGTYNTSTSSVTNTETEYSVNACLMPYNDKSIMSEGLIKAGDFKLIVSPKQTNGDVMVVANPQDKVTVASDVYIIVNVKPLYPANELVYQEWQIRR